MNFYLSLLKQILIFPFNLIDKLFLFKFSVKGVTIAFSDVGLGIISTVRGLINMHLNGNNLGYKLKRILQ